MGRKRRLVVTCVRGRLVRAQNIGDDEGVKVLRNKTWPAEARWRRSDDGQLDGPTARKVR